MNGILGRKLGMTRVFDAEGRATPVTVIQAGPCPIVQVKTPQGRANALVVALPFIDPRKKIPRS